MRFGFVTCVELGLSCLKAILDVGGMLDLAMSLPDEVAQNKSGRVYLDDICDKNGIPLIKSPNINDPIVVDSIKAAELDWLFIIGWSQIARADILAAPKRGVLGMHPTLLPQGRGRAAIPWAILKGLDATGVTLFKLDGGVDTGDIIAQKVIAMHPNIDATQLYAKVNDAHVALMKDIFPRLRAGAVDGQRQDETQATVWPGRSPEDGRINRQGSVKVAERMVRALTRPYPGAFVETEEGKLIIWRASIMTNSEQRHSDKTYLDFHDGTLHCLETELS
jgi:methionyl-tRNA formyltransferase